jgi:hypothetical protein
MASNDDRFARAIVETIYSSLSELSLAHQPSARPSKRSTVTLTEGDGGFLAATGCTPSAPTAPARCGPGGDPAASGPCRAGPCFFDCVQRREQKYPRLCGVRAVIAARRRVNDWPQVVQTSITSPWRRHCGIVSGSVCRPRFSLE